jgi:hypothetical protein
VTKLFSALQGSSLIRPTTRVSPAKTPVDTTTSATVQKLFWNRRERLKTKSA